MEYILEAIDILFFCLFLFPVLYIFIFSISAYKKNIIKYPATSKLYKIIIFIPAYKEDSVIEQSVDSILAQKYDRSLYDVVVISDSMGDEINSKLFLKDIILLAPKFEKSSKSNSLKYAVNYMTENGAKMDKYDIAVILDSDNIVEPGFLYDICAAFDNGMKAVQARRVAKNTNTDIALLDAVSEEVNNAIFRYAQVKRGYSAALSGSGMAFEYSWFCNNIHNTVTAGEDKELERMLLKQGIFIDFLNDTLVYDEKVKKNSSFYSQRRRWMAAQFDILKMSLKDLPDAISERNIDYCNKIFQWTILPRVLLAGLLGAITIGITILSPANAIKWWILSFTLAFAIAFAIPDYLVDKRFKRAVRHVPYLGLLMFVNLFRVKNTNKEFIHTEHGA